MDSYINYLKNAAVKTATAVSPTFAAGKSIYDAFKPKTATVAPPAVAPPAPVTPTKTVTPASPSAVTPTVKTPAAQTYIQSQANPSVVTPPTATPTAPATPTTPTYTDSPGSPSSTGNPAMDQYITAYKKYIDTQTNNSELSEAKKYLNQLVLDDKKAREKALNSGETMGFAGGEEARVARNNSFAIEGAQNNVNSLEAEKTNATNAAKGGVDQTKNQLDFSANADKTKADAAKTKFDQEMANKKFDEDKRQFGLDYALKARETAVKESEARTKAGETSGATTQKQADALSGVNLINSLLSNTGIGGISGAIQGIGVPFSDLKLGDLNRSGDVQLARNQFDQIKGMLALENRSKLKGQGAVSDFEGKTLDRAASSLGRNLSDDDFKKQLKQVRGAIATSNGQKADVLIVDPKTKQSQIVNADSSGIANAIRDGLIVEYQ